jgi:hypothetical protein
MSHIGCLDQPENESIHGNYRALVDDNSQLQSHCLGFERMYAGFHPQQIQQHFSSACQEAKIVAVGCCSPNQKAAPITTPPQQVLQFLKYLSVGSVQRFWYFERKRLLGLAKLV